uniref:Uncharacterized protein n=1 Tax=Panagrolaimus sp. JU765 TaxID=591449 RepID=A0AC34Q624_9BILA
MSEDTSSDVFPEEMFSTDYSKPPIRRFIVKVPGKDDIRGRNPQMKMIGPEVEDALQRKNYIHLSTRFELLRRGYMIKADSRPDAQFNVKAFSSKDPEYQRWKEANTSKEMKYDIYGKPIQRPRGPFPARYDTALNLHDPCKFYPDGTPKPESEYVREELPNYEYFLVPRRCKKGVIKYFRPQQKIPFPRNPFDENAPLPSMEKASAKGSGWSQVIRKDEKAKMDGAEWPKLECGPTSAPIPTPSTLAPPSNNANQQPTQNVWNQKQNTQKLRQNLACAENKENYHV